MGKPPGAAADKSLATSRVMLMLLVVMTGIAPVSLYLLVPALPQSTTLPLTSAILALPTACASTMIFIVPRRKG